MRNSEKILKSLSSLIENGILTSNDIKKEISTDLKFTRDKIINKLHELGLESLEAYYVCVLVGIKSLNDPMPLIAQGEIHGYVSINSSGCGGFGYDKIFYPNNFDCSMASIEPGIKNSISHRAIASTRFLEIYNNY